MTDAHTCIWGFRVIAAALVGPPWLLTSRGGRQPGGRQKSWLHGMYRAMCAVRGGPPGAGVVGNSTQRGVEVYPSGAWSSVEALISCQSPGLLDTSAAWEGTL